LVIFLRKPIIHNWYINAIATCVKVLKYSIIATMLHYILFTLNLSLNLLVNVHCPLCLKRNYCKLLTGNNFKYCESILFCGAEISSFEDDGHIRGYLTSWIALPTKLKKYIYYLQFLTGAKLRPNTETGSIAKLRISEWLCLLSYVTPEDIDPRQPVNVFTAESSDDFDDTKLSITM